MAVGAREEAAIDTENVTVRGRIGRRPRSRVRRPQVRPPTIYCAPVRNPPCSTPFATALAFTILFGTVLP